MSIGAASSQVSVNGAEWDDEVVHHPRVSRTVSEWRQIGVPHYWLSKRWRQFVVGPFGWLDGGYYLDSPHLQADSGVYFLWGADDNLLYVGMSVNIPSRMQQHIKASRIPAACLTYIKADPDIARVVERVYIEALLPPYNAKVDHSGWNGHSRMVTVVRRLWHKALREPKVG